MHTPLSADERASLWVRLTIRLSLTTLCIVALLTLGSRLISLFAPFLLALLVAWFLHPPVYFFQKKLGFSRRTVSLVILFLCCSAVGGTLYGLVYAAFVQIRALAADWSSVRQSFLDLFGSFSAMISSFSSWLPIPLSDMADHIFSTFLEWLQSVLPAALDASLGGASSLMSRLPSFAISTIVFIMASYFITADYPRLRFLAVDQLPVSAQEFGKSFLHIFREAFGGYIRSQFLLSLGVFAILSIGFLVIGQPYGLLLALIFSLLDFIPIIGSGTIMVPWSLISFIIGNYRTAVELIIIWGLVALFRRMAEPKILGNQTGLSPILSLVGIYLGMRAGGIFGMVIGPLALLVFINLCKLGTFDPTWRDIKLCASDLSAILSPARRTDR